MPKCCRKKSLGLMVEFFKYDHVIRTEGWAPLGHVILSGDYIPGEKIPVALLEVPKMFWPDALGQVCWVDGRRYRVPADLSRIKVNASATQWLLNNFYLVPA